MAVLARALTMNSSINFDNTFTKSIHFSHLLGVPIVTNSGRKLGKLRDVFVDFEEMYPQILALQFIRNNIHFYVNWTDILTFGTNRIIVKDELELGRSRTLPRVTRQKVLNSSIADQFRDQMIEYPPLGKIILDRQIVDTFGKKVVRVNDLEFVKAGNLIRITHAAIGLRSMIRRLGYENLIDSFVKIVKPNSEYLSKEPLINWKFVHAIPDKSVHTHLRLSLKNEEIQNLHPADLADILEDLDNHSRDVLFSNLSPELAAATLSEVETDLQVELLENETPDEAAKIIENMAVDQAVDVLSELEEEKASEIIAQIKDDDIQEDIQELLEYEEDTAGGLMSSMIFEIMAHYKKPEVLRVIREGEKELESINNLFIIDNNKKLIGQIALPTLLIQDDSIEIGKIMNDSDIKFLGPETHWKDVARFMSKYNLINVPIVDSQQILLGVVSVDDVLPWLLDEK